MLADSLAFQLDRLRLNERYPKQINLFLFGQRMGMLDAYGADNNSDTLRVNLETSATSLERDFGLNDWRPALMRGLVACNEFCQGGVRNYFAAPRPGGA